MVIKLAYPRNVKVTAEMGHSGSTLPGQKHSHTAEDC